MEFTQYPKKVLHKIHHLFLKVKKRCALLPCILVTCLILLIILLIVAYVIKRHKLDKNVKTIYIDSLGPPQNIVNDKFLSLGLDTTVITGGFQHFNMTDPKLTKMIRHLSPAYLRVGGNYADLLIFSPNDSVNTESYNKNEFKSNESSGEPNHYFFSGSDWLKLNSLAKNAEINMIFDLNSLLRFKNGSWDPQNAEEMITFSENHNLTLNWELGNEPNSFLYKFNISVNATQLAMDYVRLKKMLMKHDMYKNSLLVGPSTTRLRTKNIGKYFKEFLEKGAEVVGAITWHHYYFSGYNATPKEFLDPQVFDLLELHINRVKKIVYGLDLQYKPIWLGETAAAWGGGAPNLTDRFIDCFIWLDKLGLSAKMGMDLVVRQSIFEMSYALLNDTYDPNPDWWLSVLYKKLVSNIVVTTNTEGEQKIRLYAHCARNNSIWGDQNSSLVVFGVNLSHKKGYVDLKELKAGKEVYVFELTSDGSLFSQKIRLNGYLLDLLPNYELPEFKPKIIEKSNTLSMAPHSIVFWIFINTNVVACITR